MFTMFLRSYKLLEIERPWLYCRSPAFPHESDEGFGRHHSDTLMVLQ